MATGYPLDTPERVLKRVHQLELQELELPSLPSFQDDIDYESGSAGETSVGSVGINGSLDRSEIDPTTPHPLRKSSPPRAPTPSAISPLDSSSTTSSSPFPPLPNTSDDQTSPYAPNTALTSTPYSQAGRTRRYASENETRLTMRYGAMLERTRSVTEGPGSSTNTGREKWHTPGEMSASFSGDEILADGVDDMEMGGEVSLPLPLSNISNSFEHMTETPLTRRLSTSKHVLMQRPGRRFHSSGAQPKEIAQPLPSIPTPIAEASSPAAVHTTLRVTSQDRMPSLSKSEESLPETSVGATTPDGPSRRVAIASPALAIHRVPEYTNDREEQGWEVSLPVGEQASLEYSQSEGHDEATLMTPRIPSPVKSDVPISPGKPGSTLAMSHYSTPGVAREPPVQEDSYASAIHHIPSTMLRDVTESHQTPSVIFTPSPVGMNSKLSDFSTPRAPLNDAERRKSHVLAVLQSTGLPSRTLRTANRGTPHPLRRVSMPPSSDSNAEESLSQTADAFPFPRTPLTIDSTLQPANESFVSIASSADLTSDRRAANHHRLSRGNTSFPAILLPTSGASPAPGGSLRGLSEGRADGAKIHKHLNAMNKQLLDTNADLAREAEAWRDEVGRLRRILQDASIEVEEVDVMANLTQAGGSFSDLPAELRRRPEGSLGASSGLSKPSSWQDRFDRQLQKSDMIVSQLSQLGVPRGSPGERVDSDEDEHTLAPQEMAQRLRELEAGMDDKDRMIEELHGKLSRGMGSVDREAEGLKQQLEDAERDRVALQEEFALKTQQHAAKFGEICSGFEEQVKDLEARLGSAREECERLRADKSRLEALTAIDSLGAREVEWRRQVAGLETELSRAKDDAKARAAAAASSEKHSVQLREERQELMREAETAKAQLEDVQSRFDAFKGQLEDVKAELDEVKTELAEALAAKETAENDVMQLNQDIGELQLANADQVTELDGQHQQIEELVRALRELEQQVVDSESPKQLADSEELDELRQELEEVAATIADKDAELEALRGKLEVAEMAANQLRRSQTSASPDRTPMRDRHVSVEDQASFVVAIEERLDEAYREIGRLKHELAATPHRKSGIETRDAKIKALEREKAALVERLGAAKAGTISSHTSILQSAGSPFTRPTPFVHRAVASLETLKTPGPLKDTTIGDANEPLLRAHLEHLEGELHRANEQLDHNFSRLEAAGFGGIALAEKLAAAQDRIAELEDEIRALTQRNKASLALVSAQKRESNRDDDMRLQRALETVHEQLDTLKSDTAAEKARLQRDNARMQDLLSELQLKSRKEVECLRAEAERAAEKMREEVKEAEAGMFAGMRERNIIERDLQASAARVRQLERELLDQRQAYDNLAAKQSRSNRDATSADLEEKLETIRTLQASLRDANASSDRLRDALRQRTEALERAESAKASLESEREKIIRDLAEFEQDLRAQTLENQRFGAELQKIKLERQSVGVRQPDLQTEREYRATKDRLRVVSKELNEAKHRCDELQRWRDDHMCNPGTQTALDDQRARFKAQSRELAAQIRYLKAKFTRESTFRNALALQKRYLLLLVGGMSLNEQATLKAIASMGFPTPEPPRQKRTLKAVGLAVVGLVRARNTSQRWREEREMKAGTVTHHSERRWVPSRT